MRTVARYWKAFRAWPGIAQAAVWMTVFVLVAWMIPAPAKAADDEGVAIQVKARAICEGGKLIGIELFTPIPGVITIPIPPTVCTGQPQGGEPAPKPEKRPARLA